MFNEWLVAEGLRFAPKLSAVSLGGSLNSFGVKGFLGIFTLW